MKIPDKLPVDFLWPEFLWGLLLVPLAVAGFLWLTRRRRQTASRYAALLATAEGGVTVGAWRRRVPALLFLLALTALVIATARPLASLSLPAANETVILAIDVSGSMRAADVEPSRIAAAQKAAREFVNRQPRTTRIGIVTFAGSAAVAQFPTQNREDILAALDRIELQRATAIGSGILIALKAIYPDLKFNLNARNPKVDPQQPLPWETRLGAKKAEEFKPVPPGSNTSAAIVVLTDGVSNTGPDPVESSKMAAERGVRIYTVGIGTPQGEVLNAGGMRMRVRLDEEPLKQVAATTRGEYFFAATSEDLSKVYRSLNARFTFERRETEVSAFFAAAGALLAIIAAFLSLAWFNRIL